MEKPVRERDVVAIVLLGKFNPAIFQPAWLALHDLIRKQEAEDATVGIVHQDISDFSIGWLRVEVNPIKFVATANITHVQQAVSLVQGVFTLLEHTPVEKMGLNRLFDYRMPSLESWHAFENRLAPKVEWEGLMTDPGLLSLTMSGKRAGSPSASVQVKTAPSRYCQPGYGVFFEVNETFDAGQEESALRQILRWLKDEWSPFQAYSEAAVEKLLTIS